MQKLGKKLIGIVVLFGLIFGVCGCKNGSEKKDATPTDGVNASLTDASQTDVGENDEEAVLALYEEYLKTEASRFIKYNQGKYGYYDINQDGIRELIIKELDRLSVIAYVDGELKIVYSAGDSTLLENGMIQHYQPVNMAENESYAFYQYNEDAYEMEARYFRRKEENPEYNSFFYGYFREKDVYEMLTPETDGEFGFVSMEDWMWSLGEYLEIPAADVEFSNMNEETPAFESEAEAYQAFLEGKCSVTVGDYNKDDLTVVNLNFKQGQEYCLYDILDLLNNETWDGEDTHFYANCGGNLSYAYIDCEGDGNRELALKLVGYMGGDAYTVTYIIKYTDLHLELLFGMEGWARDRRAMNQYGYVRGDGSSGATHSSGEEYVVDSEGNISTVLEWEYTSMYSPLLFHETVTALRLMEIYGTWRENYDGEDALPLEGMGVTLYVMGDSDYLVCYLDEESENRDYHTSFLQSCEDAGITFYSKEEIEDVIATRREQLGVADLAEEEEAEWHFFALPEPDPSMHVDEKTVADSLEIYANYLEPMMPKEELANLTWDADILPYMEYDWTLDPYIRHFAIMDPYSSWEMQLVDLNSDGQREMLVTVPLWSMDDLTEVYTVKNGEVYYCGEIIGGPAYLKNVSFIEQGDGLLSYYLDAYQNSSGEYRYLSGEAVTYGLHGYYQIYENTFDGTKVSCEPLCAIDYFVDTDGNKNYQYVWGSRNQAAEFLTDDQNYTAFRRALKEYMAGYQKVELSFAMSSYPVPGAAYIFPQEERSIVCDNIVAGFVEAMGYQGKWNRTEVHTFEEANIVISNWKEGESFDVSIQGGYSQYIGVFEGTAYFTGEDTAELVAELYSDKQGTIYFVFSEDAISVDHGEDVSMALGGGGVADLRGTYVREPEYIDTIELEELFSVEELDTIKSLLGDNYHILFEVPIEDGLWESQRNSKARFYHAFDPGYYAYWCVVITNDGTIYLKAERDGVEAEEFYTTSPDGYMREDCEYFYEFMHSFNWYYWSTPIWD